MKPFPVVCDIFERAPAGLAILDPQGLMNNVNQYFCEILGFEESDLVGKKFTDLLAPDEQQDWLELKKALDGVFNDFTNEKKLVKKDGSSIWACISGSLFRERHSHHCLISVFDITNQHETREELRKSETRFRMAEKARNDAVWEWDLETNQISWNRGVESLLGYHADEIGWHSSWWIEKIHPEDRNRAMDSLEEVLRERKPFWNSEYRLLCADGHYATLLEKAYVEYNPSGKPVRIVGSKIDISDIRRYQKELEKAKEEALRAAEAKSAFLANISHEIRTPLGAILGFTEFLLDPEVTPSRRIEYLLTIQRNGEMLSHLVNEILDLAKLEFHSMKVDRVDFDLREVVHYVDSVLRFRAQQKGIGLNFKLSPDLPSHVKTDPVRFQQILINIIGNAVKFTEKGQVDVSFEVLAGATEHDEMKLRCIVKDTGIGLTSLEQSRLFQRFVQADETMTRRFGGTGLGLFLSRELAHALGGDVILERSRPGEGSTFIITVAAGSQTEKGFIQGSRVSSKAVPNLEGLSILLADDSVDNQSFIYRILAPTSASIALAEDGREALEKALNDNFDLILMDVEMPVMNGLEAVQKLRSSGYRKPILAITAHSNREQREKILQAGFDDIVPKPIQREGILNLLSRLVRQESGRALSPPVSEVRTLH